MTYKTGYEWLTRLATNDIQDWLRMTYKTGYEWITRLATNELQDWLRMTYWAWESCRTHWSCWMWNSSIVVIGTDTDTHRSPRRRHYSRCPGCDVTARTAPSAGVRARPPRRSARDCRIAFADWRRACYRWRHSCPSTYNRTRGIN